MAGDGGIFTHLQRRLVPEEALDVGQRVKRLTHERKALPCRVALVGQQPPVGEGGNPAVGLTDERHRLLSRQKGPRLQRRRARCALYHRVSLLLGMPAPLKSELGPGRLRFLARSYTSTGPFWDLFFTKILKKR